MAPDAEDCEQVERLNGDYQEVPVHQGRRVQPEQPPPAQAWVEHEEPGLGGDSRTNSPGESRRLLGSRPPQKPPCRLQAGLTLGVRGVKKPKCSTIKTGVKTREKTKFQRRKEKLKQILGPPYFIISMLFLLVVVHLCWPEAWRARMEWVPGPWWREPWRLLSYSLVHADAEHLALNAIMALAVGWRLECEQGWAAVAALWAGGVAAGALAAGVLQPAVRVVGASAAVYALLTAHLPNVCLRFGHIPLWWFRPLSVLVLGASEVCWALLRSPNALITYHLVAWSSHALGAVVGVPLAFLVFKGENAAMKSIIVVRILSFILLLVLATYYFNLINLVPRGRPSNLTT